MNETADYYQLNRPDEKVLSLLEKQYGPGQKVGVEELAIYDSFHLRGRAASISLAASVGMTQGLKILDVGSGPGGTARYLSDTFGAQVIGLDLTYSFSRLAKILSDKSRLSDFNRFVCASALEIPFNEEAFHMVWMEHVQMNIRDKALLVSELHRVLKSGGTLAMYEVFQSGNTPPDYPLPWAETPVGGTLTSHEIMKELLITSGFDVISWHDCLEEIKNWDKKRRLKRSSDDKQLLGAEMLMGDHARNKVENITTAVLDKRLMVIEAVLKKL